MRISRLGGRVVTESDTTLSAADKIECLFEADGAIPVGSPCTLDITSNTGGKLIVASETANFDAFVGVYEGDGGTGAETTVSGLKGRAAVDGDVVYVTAYGVAEALCDGGTTDIAAGDALTLEVDAGEFLVEATAIPGGLHANAIALEALATTTGNIAVFVRAL